MDTATQTLIDALGKGLSALSAVVTAALPLIQAPIDTTALQSALTNFNTQVTDITGSLTKAVATATTPAPTPAP